MLGMLGVIVQNNSITNTTQILQEVEPGKRYLVKFCNEPAFNRVCQIEEIQGWLLFQNQAELNVWIQKSSGAPPPKGDGKAGAKKPEGKQGGTRKRSPAKPKDQ